MNTVAGGSDDEPCCKTTPSSRQKLRLSSVYVRWHRGQIFIVSIHSDLAKLCFGEVIIRSQDQKGDLYRKPKSSKML